MNVFQEGDIAMKLSILPVSLFPELTGGRMTIASWASFAQQAGADGYDASVLFFPSTTATTVLTIKRQLQEQDLSIPPVMLCSYPDFTHPDELERERQIDYFRRDIALASAFGFPYIRMTAGQAHPGLSIDEGVRSAASCIERVIDTAEKYHVKLCLENHAKPGAWPKTDFTFRPEAFIELFRIVKDMPVGINFDTGNAMACGADPVQLLETVIDRVWTGHLNDTSTVGSLTPVLVGTGLVDFDAIFGYLKRHGFDGWVCIEEASGRGLRGISEAITFARKYVPASRKNAPAGRFGQ